MSYQIEVKRLAKRDLAVVKFRARPEEIGAKMGQVFGTVMQFLGRKGVQAQAPAMAIYEAMTDSEFEMEAGFPVGAAIEGDGEVRAFELPAGEAAVTEHVGPYQELGKAYDAVRAWILEHGREPGDIMWEEYWSEPSTPPAETRTVVYWPLKPA